MRSWGAMALYLMPLLATAQPSVSLNGLLGRNAAILVINGQVRTVRVGQQQDGVRLVEVGDGSVAVEVDGQRRQLLLGAAPVAQRSSSGRGQGAGQRIVLSAGSGGHFVTSGSINGGSVQFLVDTGATTVSMSRAQADRLGLNYRNGRPVRMQTANGVISGYLMTLDRVRIGDVEIGGVEATVAERDMPVVLLGNSFLSRFQMKRENETLVLERRF
ncbi:MAG: TIGR02281 family clan AA aspartic protease [Burkholderiales bacterium]|uniref:retropepsin-like aspartic protease family protein n=1 Tax=Inhella sp. TaxID=1921806 RepID=UPI001AD3A915|nr:TIGR02281 family clan AA aspartic protease [Burkholderiales bacterium]